MRELLQIYAEAFTKQLEEITLEDSEQRSVHHPVVFLFLGDHVCDALESIIHINEGKWHNSSGVVYFHAYQTKSLSQENVLSFKLPEVTTERKLQRKLIYESFYQDDTRLIKLNQTFRRLSSKIAEYGKVYSSLQKLNLCVITRIDDPMNILIQEFTLLLKSILQESYKSVEVDLYGLLTEIQDESNFALSAARGNSFLKELDLYQQDGYFFKEELQLTEDSLRLAVTHSHSPLFDLVYLLSDKNENGLLTSEAKEQNYELISHLNLLKNRKMITDYHEKMDSYSHAAFRLAIKGNSSQPVYSSAGFSNVKRPNKTIAINTASLFFTEVIERLKQTSTQPVEKILELFELSEYHLEKQIRTLLPSSEKLVDMNGLIGTVHSYQEIKRLTVKQAEDYLFESGAELFFYTNFEEPVQLELKNLNMTDQLRKLVSKKILNHEHFGIYCAFLWTSVDVLPSAATEVNKMLRTTRSDLLAAEARLEQQYQQQVDDGDFKRSLLFADKRNLKSYLHYFFESVYGTKYEMNRLKVKLEILKQYQLVLQEIHQSLCKKINIIDEVQSLLKQAAAESLYDSDEYLDKNIPEYYQTVIHDVTARLQEKRGANFFSEERYFGNLSYLLEEGPYKLLERLLLICDREVLSQEEFHRSFEDELLGRANVRTGYDNHDILSREALFKQLYQRLRENSAVQIEVYNYSQVHRHEEKYFVGDFYSKFMTYALEKENEANHCKVGCAHEKKSTGIEKLALMGGFELKDLLYYQKAERYYQAYLENGYEFHAETWKVRG
ncbi:hypothetical protein [Bacillus sp. MRMR6]|uniref:hypothetical protein n=1 Tax=Bacillus sp. MRMR6 TaxID=1928617 RepID=UPI0009534F22|nr:hypothetical protein [Bacillus sp. MRMR6]OLS33938.1 hypothetical protein BTR25_23325 [Bacillus sp. MRMR6]